MKRLFFVFFVLTIALTSKAYDFESSGIYYNVISSTELTAEVTHNGDGTYSGDIVIPDNVNFNGRTLKIIRIGNSAFYKSENMSSITLGNNIEEIGAYAFQRCTGLSRISLPESVKKIEKYAFSKNTFSIFTIPGNINEVGSYAFWQCEQLAEVIIENGVKTFGDHVFNNCTSLTKVIIPNSVESIDWSAFYGCSKLNEVIIEDSENVLKLGSTNPWSGAPVEKLYLGRDIGHLPGLYFTKDWVMKTPLEYTVGDKVTNIYWMACSNVKKITLLGNTPPACNSFSENQYMTVNVYIPMGSKDIYLQSEPWNNFWNIIEINPTNAINETQQNKNRRIRIYSIKGQKLLKAQKGINIIKDNSGKSYKVLK